MILLNERHCEEMYPIIRASIVDSCQLAQRVPPFKLFCIHQSIRQHSVITVSGQQSPDQTGRMRSLIWAFVVRISNIPVSILYKSIAGHYRPVRVADGPITARYRLIKNASWDRSFSLVVDQMYTRLGFRFILNKINTTVILYFMILTLMYIVENIGYEQQ